MVSLSSYFKLTLLSYFEDSLKPSLGNSVTCHFEFGLCDICHSDTEVKLATRFLFWKVCGKIFAEESYYMSDFENSRCPELFEQR